MMKKIFKFIGLVIIVGVFCSNVSIIDATTSGTLQDLKDELEDLKSQKNDSEASTNSTEEEITAKTEEIVASYNAIEEATTAIEISEKKIEESNEEIEKLSEIAAQLLLMYESIQNQDSYMSFITGADSLTDLIMRIDAITQLVNYNETTITQLEILINANEAEQINLLNTQQELEDNIETYQKKIEDLEDDLQYFAEITEDIDDQISNQEELIEYYENLGCELDQSLDDCVAIANNVSWYKPLNYGYVTSEFGYRYIWGSTSFHYGIDIGGNSEGTTVYSATSGTVAAITERSSCGGNKVFVHSYVDGKAYTIAYYHLLSINVEVGDQLTVDSVIGTVGGGTQTWWDTCTTGAHLHFQVATGFYLGGGSDGYSSYNTYVANSIEPPGFPSLYGTFSSRTAWTD